MKPLVASYCTFFLKREMLHIYRQVSGLRRCDTFVITKHRQNPEIYPFPDLEILPPKRFKFWERAYRRYLRREPPLVYRGEFESMRRILIRRDPDLLHVYFGNTGVHLLPLLEAWDRPVVVSFHGVDVQTRPRERNYLSRLQRLFQVVRLALVRSKSLGDRLIEIGCDPTKIRLNRTGIPLENFPYQARQPPVDGQWCLVQASRLIEKKGLFTTLRAFATFRDTHPKARLFFAGEGPLRSGLETRVREMGLTRNVFFTGFLAQPQLRDLFKSAHIFVHPSETTADQNREGVPNSMLEAMATGLPVVATRHGGIPEAVIHGTSGLLVAERDDTALAAALLTMAGDLSRWREMGVTAFRDVAANFSCPRQVANLEDCYFEALQKT